MRMQAYGFLCYVNQPWVELQTAPACVNLYMKRAVDVNGGKRDEQIKLESMCRSRIT